MQLGRHTATPPRTGLFRIRRARGADPDARHRACRGYRYGASSRTFPWLPRYLPRNVAQQRKDAVYDAIGLGAGDERRELFAQHTAAVPWESAVGEEIVKTLDMFSPLFDARERADIASAADTLHRFQALLSIKCSLIYLMALEHEHEHERERARAREKEDGHDGTVPVISAVDTVLRSMIYRAVYFQ